MRYCSTSCWLASASDVVCRLNDLSAEEMEALEKQVDSEVTVQGGRKKPNMKDILLCQLVLLPWNLGKVLAYPSSEFPTEQTFMDVTCFLANLDKQVCLLRQVGLLVQLLWWDLQWIWKYRIKKQPFDEDAQSYLTRDFLRLSADAWDALEPPERQDLLDKELWIEEKQKVSILDEALVIARMAKVSVFSPLS